MQLSVIRSEARLLLGQTDSSNSDFTDSQLDLWANEFYRLACVKLESVPIKERSYTVPTGASPELTLNSNTITVNRAKMLIQPENAWQELEIKDLDDLIAHDADWENADTDKPKWLVRMGTFTCRLYPPPNTSNESQASGLKTFGLELPSSLSADSDTPDLPANIHDLFPHYIAYKGFSRLAQEDRAQNQLILVNSGIKAQRNISTKFSNSKGWTWHDRDPGALDWAP